MADDYQIAAIRDGVADRLRLIPGLREVHAEFPDQVNPPAAIVLDRQGDYHQAMGDPGHSEITVEVLILAGALGASGISRSYRSLDGFISPAGPQSVKAAVEGDVTLGGVANACVVARYRDKGRLTFGGPEYIGCRFDVTCWP